MRAYQMRLSTILFVLLVTYVGFGDGLNYWHISKWLTLQSPLTFVFPLLIAGLFAYWLKSRSFLSARGLFQPLALVAIVLACSLVHAFIYSAQNVAGLLQLALFGALLPVIRAQFAVGGPRLNDEMVRSLLAVHYILCGYVVVSFLAWHLAGVNLNVARFTADNEYYGFRPSGLGYEPSWTAFGVATTFIGIFYLTPGRRAGAF